VETNVVWFEVDPELGTTKDVTARLKQRGVWVHAGGPHTVRACTHLDVSAAQAERAAETIRQTMKRLTPAR
jgi:threonine aldolase